MRDIRLLARGDENAGDIANPAETRPRNRNTAPARLTFQVWDRQENAIQQDALLTLAVGKWWNGGRPWARFGNSVRDPIRVL